MVKTDQTRSCAGSMVAGTDLCISEVKAMVCP